MSLEVIIGREATFDARFYTMAGAPVDPSGTPTYRILDQNNEYLLSGSGQQDLGAPERWYVQVMIPSGAAATDDPDDFYTINWQLLSLNGEVYNFTEKFKVYTELREDEPPIEALFGIQGVATLSDMIVTPRLPSSYSYKMVDPFGKFAARNTDPTNISSPSPTRVERSNYYFRHDIDVSNVAFTQAGVEEFQIHWNINYASFQPDHEIHNGYLASAYVMKLVFDVRQNIDKGQQWHLNESLNITDWEIIFCLLQAMDKMNSYNPTTEWMIQSLAPQLRYFLVNYACVELMRQLYLAYGLAAFDFQGQSTQLTMDTTQYIQTWMDSMESALNERFAAVKKAVNRRNTPVGVLSVNLGPGTNYPVISAIGANVRFRLRGYLFRNLF